MLIAALFTKPSSWEQPQCPLTEEWKKKMWYVYTMGYNSVVKKNDIGLFVEMWMDLESVIQGEVRKRKTNTVY